MSEALRSAELRDRPSVRPSLVEGALGAAHVPVLSAKVRGDSVGGAGAGSVPVAEASQPLALVRS